MRVQTGENVLIGGFIVTGTAPKKILLRAIGPSLAQQGVTDVLDVPELELHANDGSLIMSNDDWKSTQQADIEATGAASTNDRESAIVATLTPDSYTAIVSGKNGSSGVGLVEGYDWILQPIPNSRISAHGGLSKLETTHDRRLYSGKWNRHDQRIVPRHRSGLAGQGVNGALADPTLEVHDQNGALVATDDNWRDSQQDEIEATGIPPANDLESAIITTLPATPNTVIVAGKNGQTGVAPVEVYRLP